MYMPKLAEAENRVLPVRAENRICYHADRLWLCRGLFLYGKKDYAWREKAGDDSIENQKKVMEAWGQKNQLIALQWKRIAVFLWGDILGKVCWQQTSDNSIL